jgi:hypothetical protein
LGALAPILSSLVIKNFDVLKESYSSWIFAPLALLIVGGAKRNEAPPNGWRYVAPVATCAMLLGAAFSTWSFLTHASEYVHGPQRFVSGQFDEAEGSKAIIYDAGAEWPWSYFPLVLTHGGQIRQYLAAKSADATISAIGGTEQLSLLSKVAEYRSLIVVDVRTRTFRDLRSCWEGRCPEFPEGAIGAALIGSGEWTEIARERCFGLYDAQTRTFVRRSRS